MDNELINDFQLSANFFLDWQLNNWQDIYQNQSQIIQPDIRGFPAYLPQVMSFDNTEKNLELQDIFFQIKSEPFQLPSTLKNLDILSYYKAFVTRHNRKLFDGDCIRLAKIDFNLNDSVKTITFTLQKAKYFDYLQTNLSLDFKLNKNELSLRERIHIQQQNHRLEPIEYSNLANILGINILLITKEGALILQKRSSSTLIRPNEICSSASGTVEPKDIKSSYFSLANYRYFEPFLRELQEEISVESNHINQYNIIFLGITRELIRGGLPELFFVIYTDLTSNQIQESYQNSLEQFESQSLILLRLGELAIMNLKSTDQKHCFTQKLVNFLANYSDEISEPLWVHLWLFWKYRVRRFAVRP